MRGMLDKDLFTVEGNGDVTINRAVVIHKEGDVEMGGDVEVDGDVLVNDATYIKDKDGNALIKPLYKHTITSSDPATTGKTFTFILKSATPVTYFDTSLLRSSVSATCNYVDSGGYVHDLAVVAMQEGYSLINISIGDTRNENTMTIANLAVTDVVTTF